MRFFINIKRINRPLFLFILFLFSLLFSGCEKPTLFSSWRDREIIIDAKYKDWGDEAATYYDEKTKVDLNLANDADNLYICLITRNREIETQIMESGLVVWFDPENKQNKVLGVCFPPGLKRMGMSLWEEKSDESRDWRDQEDKSGLIDRKKEKLMDKDFMKHLETLENLQERLEIIDGANNFKNKGKQMKPHRRAGEKSGGPPEDKPLELSLEEAGKLGIEAKVGRENDYFVYELKVPISKSIEHPHAIGVKQGKPITLGLEIGGMSPGMDREMSPGGGRMPGGGGGSPGERMFEARNSFQLWMTVMLSSGKER